MARHLHPVRAFFFDLRHGWLSVTLFYLGLTLVAYLAYRYLARLPQAAGLTTATELWRTKGPLWDGLASVWFIFAWGFGVQLLVQIYQVFRRVPRRAGFGLSLRHGAWVSAHAGLFEELVFRLYAFLSSIILLHLADGWLGGWLQKLFTGWLLPAADFVTLGFLKPEFTSADWTLGAAVIIGSLFFRSAHIHYGKLSKANVWLIGMVMFWLVFNFGLPAAIAAHFLYDLCVFTAIALTAPLQPEPAALT